MNMTKIFDKYAPTTEVRHWNEDAFLKETEEIKEALASYVAHGDIGTQRADDGSVWYILYYGYTPWYEEVERLRKAGKNPVQMILKSGYREDAFANGSYSRALNGEEQYDSEYPLVCALAS